MYDLRYNPYDELILDFKLDAEMAASIPDYVWAVLAKDEFASIKDKRWDLVGLIPYSQIILNLHARHRRLLVPLIMPHFQPRSP